MKDLRERYYEARSAPMRFRFFLVESGPVFDEIQKCRADRIAARDAWFEFAKSMGVEGVYGGRSLVGVRLASPLPIGWKVCPDESSCMVPDVKTKVGKAFRSTMKKLPEKPNWADCLTTADIDNSPNVMDDNSWYHPQILAGKISKRFVIKLAWRDYPADLLAELDKPGSEFGSSCEIEFINSWKPLPSMVEIKEWEALKIVEEDTETEATP